MGKSFRPNTAVIVTDGQGHVLLCERLLPPAGSIQTVQGGIDEGETAKESAMRELQEELGLASDQFEIIDQLDEPQDYEWDPPLPIQLEKTNYIGQRQFFFLAQVNPNVEFDLDAHHPEFKTVRWGTPQELVDQIWEAKRPGTLAALEAFQLL